MALAEDDTSFSGLQSRPSSAVALDVFVCSHLDASLVVAFLFSPASLKASPVVAGDL